MGYTGVRVIPPAGWIFLWALAAVAVLGVAAWAAEGKSAPLRFDRDTVIVWKADSQGTQYDFVVRIAQFEPKRLFEWESFSNQGTVLLDPAALATSRSFQTSKLFNAGSDSHGKDETTLWLSREVFQELAGGGRARFKLDSIEAVMTASRRETMTVQVNKEAVELPVLVVSDSRGGEWWFYDNPGNPLFLKRTLRNFTQTVKSITTNRKNTLRWIKESKIRALMD